ncbi:murein L,D-transpeptidase catalytic domain family protein [Sphingomonas japonica]|uniref:murein L,D-transpeptidase catalytic domain family protein n=1 Tax=Sphingomonas japonica TaxID=511662 RepID=UPI0031CEE450
MLRGGALALGGLMVPAMLGDGSGPIARVAPKVPAAPSAPGDVLLARARAALDSHRFKRRDRLALVDFDAASDQARLRLVDLHNGRERSLLVSHGSGSDRGHTGYLQHFSNEMGSEATSEGAFRTADYYVGKHGRSQRLVGLDPTNDQALARAIVVHGAWYAEPTMVAQHGKLGRSQGCFAVGKSCLATLFDHLGKGRLIYAAKA